MTFSEFGRQIQSNGSEGTDHGNAAPMLIFGNCVGSSIVGTNPLIENDINDKAGVAMQYDFRSIYGSVLMDWFEVEESVVKQVLMHDFEYLPIIQNCSVTSTIDLPHSIASDIAIFPNPIRDYGKLQFNLSESALVKVSLFNAEGRELNIICHKNFKSGKHIINIDMKTYIPNSYFIQIRTVNSKRSIGIIKV